MNRPELDIDALRQRLPAWPGTEQSNPELDQLLAIFGADFHRTRNAVQYRCSHFASSCYQLVAHYWLRENSKGTVLVVHGYFDHIPLYRRVIDYLLEHGFSVAGFDLPGHGLSSGRRASIPDFGLYQRVLRDFLALLSSSDLPAPFHAVAQSTGGAITMQYLLECSRNNETPLFEGSVLLAPLVKPMGWRLAFIVQPLLSLFVGKIPRTFTPNSHDEDFLTLLRMEDPMQSDFTDIIWVGAMKRWVRQFLKMPPSQYAPLVVQGTLDFTVEWRTNLPVIEQKFPNAKFLRIEHAHHQLVNESTEYLQPILAATLEHFCQSQAPFMQDEDDIFYPEAAAQGEHSEV